MKPDCLQKVEIVNPIRLSVLPDGSLRQKTPDELFADLGPIAKRHGRFPKGTVLPETRQRACPRVKVADLPAGWLKQKHIERLEQDQLLSSCCRHPENHEVEAFKSHPEEPAPDQYTFYCTCGREHKFFCLGTEDVRPVWNAS